MIEAGISMVPMGYVTTPDCVSYDSSLAFVAITGMSHEHSAKAIESDVVSQILEHQLQRPVNFVDFYIRDAEVTDPFGKKIKKKALFSPDFDKNIQSITNMEEKDGQVWETTDRLSDAVVNSNGESWHLLASPGEKQSDDHRLILIHKRGDDRAREYFVTIKSSRIALEKVVENISGHSFDRHEDISTTIVSREKSKGEPAITLRDIFDQVTNVFDDREKRKRHSFLEELRKDTYLTEEELESRNTGVQRLVKTQIKEILTDKPSLEALGLVAQSIPRWAEMVKGTASYTIDSQAPSAYVIPSTTLRFVYDTETRLNAITAQNMESAKLDQQIAKQVTEPTVLILWREDNLIVDSSIFRRDQLSPQLIVSQDQPPKNKTYYDNIYYLSNDEKRAIQRPDQSSIEDLHVLLFKRFPIKAPAILWSGDPQKCFGMCQSVFLFVEADLSAGGRQESRRNGEYLSFSRSYDQGISDSGVKLGEERGSFRQMVERVILLYASSGELNCLPIKIKEGEESAGTIYNESRATIIADFQKTLEYIVNLNPEINSRPVYDKKEAAFEEEVVNLGRQILGTIFDALPFLLAVYDEESTCREARHILAVLIYKQISRLAEDKNILMQYPELSSLTERLSKSSKSAAPLEKRFDRLKRAVNRLLILDRLDDYPFNITPEYASNNILLMIFYFLVRFIRLQRSAERLSNTGRMKQTAFVPRVSKGKKKQKIFPLSGIIYFFSYQVIYQYRPLVIGRSDMTQYE